MNTAPKLHILSGNTRIRKLIACVLLCLFLFYYAGISFFVHSHNVNGTKVVHSHPFAYTIFGSSNSDALQHTHTNDQIKTLQNLDYLIFTTVAAFLFHVVLQVLRKIYFHFSLPSKEVKKTHISLRGPPLSISVL